MENNQELTVKSIAELINNKELWSTESPTAKYKGLGRLLSDINWSDVAPETIITRRGLRAFAMSIEEEEVRLDVLNFLLKFARDFFLDSAFNLSSWSPYAFNDYNAEEKAKKDAVEYIETFKEELNFQLDLINYSDQFSGEKFEKQRQRIEVLNNKIKEFNEANSKLLEELDRHKNPHKYGKHIPQELIEIGFTVIMDYLEKKKLVYTKRIQTAYGMLPCCYTWSGSKALFGYLVERLNNEYKLNKRREQLNWQIFKDAIFNYDDLRKEAGNAPSKYGKDKKFSSPEGAEIIDAAIKEAKKNSKQIKIKSECRYNADMISI